MLFCVKFHVAMRGVWVCCRVALREEKSQKKASFPLHLLLPVEVSVALCVLVLTLSKKH